MTQVALVTPSQVHCLWSYFSVSLTTQCTSYIRLETCLQSSLEVVVSFTFKEDVCSPFLKNSIFLWWCFFDTGDLGIVPRWEVLRLCSATCKCLLLLFLRLHVLKPVSGSHKVSVQVILIYLVSMEEFLPVGLTFYSYVDQFCTSTSR